MFQSNNPSSFIICLFFIGIVFTYCNTHEANQYKSNPKKTIEHKIESNHQDPDKHTPQLNLDTNTPDSIDRAFSEGFGAIVNPTVRREKKDSLKEFQIEAENILDHIYRVSGIHSLGKPKIKVTTKDIAARYRNNTVYLAPQVFQLASELNSHRLTCLYFFIGHEYYHFICDNDTSYCSDDNAYLPIPELELPGSSKANLEEYHADLFAAFVCWLCGRDDVDDILPSMIEKFYSFYKWNAESHTHPHKQDRKVSPKLVKRMAKESEERLKIGNYAIAFQDYTVAEASFSFIESFYKGVEVYNNLGVLNALKAMYLETNYSNRTSIIMTEEFLFPLSIMSASQLGEFRAKLPEDLQKEKEKLLDIALMYLKKAETLAPRNQDSKLNMLCVWNMQNQYEKVLQESMLLEKQNLTRKELANLDLIKGITYAKRNSAGDKSEAVKLFDKHIENADPGIRRIARFNSKKINAPNASISNEIEKCQFNYDDIPFKTPSRGVYRRKPKETIELSNNFEIGKQTYEETLLLSLWKGSELRFVLQLSKNHKIIGKDFLNQTLSNTSNPYSPNALLSAQYNYFYNSPCSIFWETNPDNLPIRWGRMIYYQ